MANGRLHTRPGPYGYLKSSVVRKHFSSPVTTIPWGSHLSIEVKTIWAAVKPFTSSFFLF